MTIRRALAVIALATLLAGCGDAGDGVVTSRSTTTAPPERGARVEITAPDTIAAGELVTITVRVRDDEGALSHLELRFGDEGPALEGGRDQVCTQEAGAPPPTEPPTDATESRQHAYRTAGTYEISAAVSTGGCFAPAESRRATRTIRVTGSTSATNGPLAPTAHAGHEYYVGGNRKNLVTDITGRDADGFVNRVVLDWGDGSPRFELTRPLSECTEREGRWPEDTWLQKSPSHRYDRDGPYTLTVRAWSVGCDGGSAQEAAPATYDIHYPPVQGSDDPSPAVP